MRLPHPCSLNYSKIAIAKTTKFDLKTQKNRLNRRFSCKKWSEWGDSNAMRAKRLSLLARGIPYRVIIQQLLSYRITFSASRCIFPGRKAVVFPEYFIKIAAVAVTEHKRNFLNGKGRPPEQDGRPLHALLREQR